jgi:hypothetical protein
MWQFYTYLVQLGFSSNGYLFVTSGGLFQQSSGQTFFSVLSLRVADKKSSGFPNEVDISLVNSQLIYFQHEIQLLHAN